MTPNQLTRIERQAKTRYPEGEEVPGITHMKRAAFREGLQVGEDRAPPLWLKHWKNRLRNTQGCV